MYVRELLGLKGIVAIFFMIKAYIQIYPCFIFKPS